MTRARDKHCLVLSIVPSSKGFGYAVMEREEILVDWGVKPVSGEKNPTCLAKAKELIGLYKPRFLAIPDHREMNLKRSARIRELVEHLHALGQELKIKVKLIGRKHVHRYFFVDGKGTKHAVAKNLAVKFTEELGPRLPPKRRPWESEDYRMGIFDAVALALAALR